MTLWYLSYADEEGFRGAVITEAESFLEAAKKSGRMGWSPGGQVMGLPVPPEEVERSLKVKDRLLSLEDLKAAMGDMVKPFDDEPGKPA